MIITCKACNTSFNLDDKMLKPTGSKVRCSVCANIFTVFPDQTPPEEPADDRADSDVGPGFSQAEGDMTPASPDTAVDAGETAVDEIDDAVSKALDEDISGADLGTDDADENLATMIANLEDEDLDLDLSSESAGDDEETSATIVAELEDDELESHGDESADSVETVIVDLDGDDLDLDIPAEGGDGDDSVTRVITDLDEDESLDLDDDLSLEFTENPEVAESSDDSVPDVEDELDLSLSLEVEEDDSPAESEISEPVDLDTDDLTLELDLETDTADEAKPTSEPVGAGGNEDDGEMDLVLDLEDDGPAKEKPDAASPMFEDDLDMSSLEEMFNEEDAGDGETVVVDLDEASEDALELETDRPTTVPGESDAPEETLANLELELDEDDKPEASGAGDADSELDLSDIEKMLEEPQSGGQKISAPEQDLDLDIEASLESEKWMSESGDSQLVADEELDLSELEQVLEDVDASADEDTAEDQELELDLSDESQASEGAETVVVDGDLDFDLSDFGDDAPAKSGSGAPPKAPADMELEFELEEDGEDDQTLPDDGLEETVAVAEAEAAPAEDKADELAPPPPQAPKPKPVKKGTSKSLIFLLVLIIFGGAGYGTYYYLDKSGIDIPYVSDYLKPKAQDPGNLKLTTYDINSRFIDNANVGKLFVITGKVKNGYDENRGMISLVGKIFSSGKVPVHEELVYCGNVMSDLELANLEWDKIQARLANRLGDNRSNVKIEPGKSIPFMVVFSGLPDDLEEFTIEVTGSTSLK